MHVVLLATVYLLLQLPFDGVDISWDKKFTYLDTQGRPVLVLRKDNLVPGQGGWGTWDQGVH